MNARTGMDNTNGEHTIGKEGLGTYPMNDTVKPRFKVEFADRPKSTLYHIENINWDQQFA